MLRVPFSKLCFFSTSAVIRSECCKKVASVTMRLSARICPDCLLEGLEIPFVGRYAPMRGAIETAVLLQRCNRTGGWKKASAETAEGLTTFVFSKFRSYQLNGLIVLLI